MSEFLNNNSQRLEALTSFARGMVDRENGKQLIEQYQPLLDTVTPAETMQVLDSLLVGGYPNEVVKAALGRILNIFYKSLNGQTWEKPGASHFLSCLMRENRAVEALMTEIKAVVKTLFGTAGPDEANALAELRRLLDRLARYELHYIKKENILFPYIEKAFPQYRCLQLMWSFHDDFRRSLKILAQILAPEHPDKETLNKELGKLFFVVLPIVFREEQIVFPVAYRAIPQPAWDEMMGQSYEIGWCYIEPPLPLLSGGDAASGLNGKIDLGTGLLTPEQLMLLFNHLPVDITFVDEHDEVCYFSGAKHRIFPRSKAIIGRKVQNCHPHESVHVVNDILAAFRSGEKDCAGFWIQLKGRFIHIRYFALRDDAGNYKGTIEVSQDATEIRALQGERRLLEWDR